MILTNQTIEYALNRPQYFRNKAREELANGTPVYFNPTDLGLKELGFGGPKYIKGYTYYNSNSAYNGNCTWWCNGRVKETTGIELGNIGNAWEWYDNYKGEKDTNADNARVGDVIVLKDSSDGHVMFIEQIDDDGTIHISQSAYSRRACWVGMACLVTTYKKSEIVKGRKIDMYKGIGNAYYEEVVGVIHTGKKDLDYQKLYVQQMKLNNELKERLSKIHDLSE